MLTPVDLSGDDYGPQSFISICFVFPFERELLSTVTFCGYIIKDLLSYDNSQEALSATGQGLQSPADIIPEAPRKVHRASGQLKFLH